MSDCLFCKIIQGDIPSKKVFENDKVLAFHDINPLAKIHLLFIHKEHSKNVVEMSQTNPKAISEVFQGISEYCRDNNLAEPGVRVVTNVGRDAGQTVFHTHFHVLSGEQLKGFGA
ncbi:histidine triad nucleotide-binding protein [Bacteriovoracaceae bacterium]|nr:histidine triad nucleotide-binding protein [Bacteriovoracaceae bacterium]